jgi:tetratricopeptide (TPR) repeat protein
LESAQSTTKAPKITPIYEIIPEPQIQSLASLILGSVKQVREGFHHAISDYRSAITHRQDIPLLYLDIIHYHATLKQFEEAETILHTHSPESLYYSIGEAIIAYHQKKPDLAIQKLTPHHHSPLHIIHRLLILSYIQLLDEKSAIDHIHKIAQDFSPEWHAQATILILPSILEEIIWPSESLTQALRALLKKASETSQTTAILAAAEFEIAIQKPILALELLRQATHSNKHPDIAILMRLADLEYQHNTPQSALPYYLQAFKRNPNYPTLRESIAKLYTRLDQYDQALLHWQAINQQNPTQIQPIIEIALIYEKNKNNLEALKYWQQALILQPNNPRLHIAVILSKLTSKQLPEALQDALTFTKQFPTLPRSHYLEGIIQFHLKNYNAANAAFSQAEILATTADPEILDPQFYIQRATIFEYLKQYQDATETLHRAHKKFPENIVIMNNLAYSWAEQNIELEQALTLSLKTIEAEPQNPSFLDTLGWIYYRLHRYSEALTTLEKAHAIDPENAIILDHLADAHAKNNNITQAIKFWKKALPNHDTPKEIEKKIAQAQTATSSDKSTAKNLPTLTQGSIAAPTASHKQ